MATTFQDILDEFTEAAHSQRDKGTLFERLVANYLHLPSRAYRYTYRGLSPHQFMLVPGVYKRIHSTENGAERSGEPFSASDP